MNFGGHDFLYGFPTYSAIGFGYSNEGGIYIYVIMLWSGYFSWSCFIGVNNILFVVSLSSVK